MTESELMRLRFLEVSILQLMDKKVLILLCNDQQKAIELHALIKSTRYSIKSMLTTSKTHKIALDFLDTGYFMGLDTKKTSKQYPPFDWLINGQVQYLTAGYRMENNTLSWSEDLLPLSRPFLN
ncbi:MAG: hypothetical protein V4541_10515 [Bacteroidota bacterium]